MVADSALKAPRLPDLGRGSYGIFNPESENEMKSLFERNENAKVKAFVTELIGDESFPLSEVEALAINASADDCNWHTREKFESLYWFRSIDNLCISDGQPTGLWALVDDGRKEGAVWFPVEVWLKEEGAK